jgi:hypothetical protein
LPGSTISTRTPNGATSPAIASDRPSSANLAAQYAETPGPAIRPPCELIWTIGAGTLRTHPGQDSPRERRRPEEHRLHRTAQVIHAHLLERANEPNASVVDEDIDATEALHRGRIQTNTP